MLGQMSLKPRFGEQRLVRTDVNFAHRAAFRILGVAEPAHYLHHKYLRLALDRVNGLDPESILDAGCGSGDHTFYLARRFPRAEVLGVDIDEGLIVRNRVVAAALGLRNITFEVASITEPLSRLFDVIVSIDVLEHLVEQQKALHGLCNALAPRGVAFFHVPTIRPRPVPFSRWLVDFHAWAEHEHLADDLTAEQFEQRVAAAGFKVSESWRTFGYWAGEMATSLFALPYRNSLHNRALQLMLAPICRALVGFDRVGRHHVRYAVALLLTKDDRAKRYDLRTRPI